MRGEAVVSKEEGLGGGEARISVGCLVQSQTACHVGRGKGAQDGCQTQSHTCLH